MNKKMTINQVLSFYSPQLQSSSPILDVELLLSKIIHKPKEYLYINPQKKLTHQQLAQFQKLYKRRLKGEPIAYLLGQKEFYGLDFIVNKNVLIPRPETELLVEEVIKFAKNKKNTFIDVGTGSGAIIISLAKNLNGKFYGLDISARALKVARQNTKRQNIKIKFFPGNLLTPLKSKILNLKSNFIITANLPYLDKKAKKLLPSSDTRGLKFEPRQAWDGGSAGLKYFKLFFSQIKKYQLQPKAIFLEIGYHQATALKKITNLALPNYHLTIKKDLCGFDRLLIITK